MVPTAIAHWEMKIKVPDKPGEVTPEKGSLIKM